MNSKNKIITVNSGLSQVVYLAWEDDYEKNATRFVLDTSITENELIILLSSLIESIIKKTSLDYSLYMNSDGNFTHYGQSSLLRLLKDSKFKHYVFLVAGDNIDKTKILNHLSKKWPNDDLYRFFPQGVQFIFGPATQDGDGYYFFFQREFENIFKEELAKLCNTNSFQLIYDVNN